MPEQERPARDDEYGCRDRSDGFGCTRPHGHAGDHIAFGTTDDECARWPSVQNSEKPVPEPTLRERIAVELPCYSPEVCAHPAYSLKSGHAAGCQAGNLEAVLYAIADHVKACETACWISRESDGEPWYALEKEGEGPHVRLIRASDVTR